MTSSTLDKANVNAKLYAGTLIWKNVILLHRLFEQDSAPAHKTKLAQDWIATNCSEFIGKDEWPPNSLAGR